MNAHYRFHRLTALGSPLRTRFQQSLVICLIITSGIATVSYWRYQELQRAEDSQAYLMGVCEAQERFRELHGQYATTLDDLDTDRPEPTYFSVDAIQPGATGDLATSWSLTLTRSGESWFGKYTITYSNRGYDENRSTVASTIDSSLPQLRSLVAWVGH